MKCIVLAGGRGERLWPLSRKNYPKQFIKIQENHSIFQDTIARNLPYCDEFIIVTNYEYRYIIANQMEAFQGVAYRCLFEEIPRRTTAAIILSCLSMQPSEYIFVVAADHFIDTGECAGLNYKEAILKAKGLIKDDIIVLFGKKAHEIDKRYGYFINNGEQFFEKPDRKTAHIISENNSYYQNLGMMLFQNGFLQKEIGLLYPDILRESRKAYKKREPIPEGVLYKKEVLETITPISIEHSLLEKTSKIFGQEVGFAWSDFGVLEDLEDTALTGEGVGVSYESDNSVIVNQAPHQAVVVNDLDNVLVVNTPDAVYVGRRGKSGYLKEILHDHNELLPFSEQGIVNYRQWGYYEQLSEGRNYRIRKVVLSVGKTIYEHKHEQRRENWTIVRGVAKITLDGKAEVFSASDFVEILPGIAHQISNVGLEPVVFIETATGSILHGGDIITDDVPTITETDLGLQPDSIVKLLPAFKDYLWGGTKLRDIYLKQCDYDTIAESWELSAHPAGSSVIASGRHKGLNFSRYLETVGKDVLGWKCKPLQTFPLLIKFIDAKQNLSVQVHPGDDYALENEDEYGKNEMWYVVNAESGAGLYIGFNRDVEREEVETGIRDGTILNLLNFFPTNPGDVFFIPAGTVHAVGAGNVICEIQQSSNVTYRLYDYNRRDKFGNLRELHLEKALDVLNYKKYETGYLEVKQGNKQKHIRCKYFETTFLDVDGEEKTPVEDDSFRAVICISGSGVLKLGDVCQHVKAGDSFFIPAVNGILEASGKMLIALTRV